MTMKSDIAKAAFGWWSVSLGEHGGGRMARAQLRRCSTAAEALSVPATHALHEAFGGALRHRADTLALIAISLANVRTSSPATAAERMGGVVSALRFQTLIRCREPGDLIRPLRRALIQIDSTAHVGRLAESLFYWNDKTRNTWCFEYYAAATADPTLFEKPETETLT